MNTIFYRDRIVFKSYPYPVAAVAERPEVAASAIREIRLDRYPPEILLTSGEILFVERRERMSLALFAAINGIETVDRIDIWSLLCEPFIDVEFSRDDQRRTLHQLADAGFLAPEVGAIRQKIKSRMLAYSATEWEWVDLSHMDVLNAFGFRDRPFWPFLRNAKKRFYSWTHRISARAPLDGVPPVNLLDRLHAKLDDIAFSFPRAEEGDNPDMGPDIVPDPKKQPAAIREILADVILPAYGAHFRYHHGFEHLLRVLDCVDAFDLPKEERLALRVAALFQDVVYEPTRDGNEEESVQVMRETVAPFMPSESIELAAKLILITGDHSKAVTRLEKCMADADLLILAQDEKTYDKFTAGLRNEYRHVTSEEWRKGHLEFLHYIEGQAKKNGRIYANFHPMHEQQALLNLRREIDKLENY
jgi:predicted metal-dependent HD superfamily phosphohydrolase